jgi:hypothetical protein
MNAPPRIIAIEISQTVYDLLEVLARDWEAKSVEDVVAQLVDHAQQGVYRPGAWERRWLCQAFGEEWIGEMEQGDPYGRAAATGGIQPFQRPRKV